MHGHGGPRGQQTGVQTALAAAEKRDYSSGSQLEAWLAISAEQGQDGQLTPVTPSRDHGVDGLCSACRELPTPLNCRPIPSSNGLHAARG